MTTQAPWTDPHLANTIKYENMERKTKELQYAPTIINEIIDSKGDRLGITNGGTIWWTPLK